MAITITADLRTVEVGKGGTRKHIHQNKHEIIELRARAVALHDPHPGLGNKQGNRGPAGAAPLPLIFNRAHLVTKRVERLQSPGAVSARWALWLGG
jgi:hypothetical protein